MQSSCLGVFNRVHRFPVLLFERNETPEWLTEWRIDLRYRVAYKFSAYPIELMTPVIERSRDESLGIEFLGKFAISFGKKKIEEEIE